ncbi:hypothetical protein ANN_18431, partial [Periplaneta americana]
MAGLCEGGNEPPGSLKGRVGRQYRRELLCVCVCGVPTASRAVASRTGTSSLAGSPWGVSLPRNTRLYFSLSMLPGVL